MKFDAIIVAGGRGSRLGGVSKPLLEHRGETLLEHSLHAVRDAQAIAVVGGHALADVVTKYMETAPDSQRVLITREYPSYAGPA
ncbi:MAG: NTP transferase domain-containing protein, partial [Micrococcaceae bacterium]|nr:NTP transferase domain-containing protein [Micrococcaceae bacterium]